jgi:hypothetical protein
LRQTETCRCLVWFSSEEKTINKNKLKKNIERETERRRRTESQLQLVLIIHHDSFNIFHLRLTDGWQDVSAATYSLSTHLLAQFLILTLTCTKCSCDFKATSNITSRFLCMWEVFLGSSATQDLVPVEQQWLTIACVGCRCFASTVMVLSCR